MATPIEQLLKSAKTLNAQEMVLEAGKSAIIWTAAGMKELTKTQLTPYDIFKLISPIMPEDKKVALVGQPSTEFLYTLNGIGEFNVTVYKEHNGIKVTFQDVADQTSNSDNSGFSASLQDSAEIPALTTTQPFTGKPVLPPTQPISASQHLPPTGNLPSMNSLPPTGHMSPPPSAPSSASPLTGRPVAPMAQPAPPPMAQAAPPMAQPAGPPRAQPVMAQPVPNAPPPFAPHMAQPGPPPTAQVAPPMAQPAPPMAQQAAPPPMKAQPVMAQPVPMAQPAPPMAQPFPPNPATQNMPPTATLAPTVALPMGSPVIEDGTAPLDAFQRSAFAQGMPLPPPQARPPLSPPISQPAAQPGQPNFANPPAASPVSQPNPLISTHNTMSRTQSSMAQTSERQRLKHEVDRLLERTVKMRGSDLHLASCAPPIVRRFGSLIRIEGEPLDPDKARMIIRELLTDDQFSRFEKSNDLDFSYEILGMGRFRGNVLRQHRGFDLTFHIVPADIVPPEELGLPSLVRDITRHHQGLILVTGAAGQGKSTTISSLVDVINSERPLHIITIEDPIEFVHPIDKRSVVNQREVGRHTHSFANALRAALREDPDVIVVGELRDLETISLAITAAETGHLVMGSLMTSSAAQTVDRVLESFPAAQQNQIRAMLSESLRAVISQRLLPRADESGMVLAAEILIGTPAVSNLIRDKKTFQIPSVIQTNRNMGMKRMDDALLELAMDGRITPQKALEFAFDKKAFEIAITRR